MNLMTPTETTTMIATNRGKNDLLQAKVTWRNTDTTGLIRQLGKLVNSTSHTDVNLLSAAQVSCVPCASKHKGLN